ncbi:MAG: tetratricopeptide repeat protein [Burkholderiaceae bacterium]|nr:tetratricopeptide repeat protein [Burkholderiaceae bacterium]
MTGDPPASDAAVQRLLLLGRPELVGGAEPLAFVPERRFQLLALLALRSGEWVSRDWIAAVLWPDRSNTQARRNLRHVVFKAHELPGGVSVEANDHALRWAVATDLQLFEAALQTQRPGQAIALRRGALLEGLDDASNSALTEWLDGERTRFQMRWHQAAIDALATPQPPQQRIELAQHLLRSDPLDEAALEALLVAELEVGRVARARQLFRDYAHRLADELGVEPSRRLRDLIDRAQIQATPAAAAAVLPEAKAHFVGRKSELAELALLLSRHEARLITIVGPGGIGKSRLAQRAMQETATRFAGGAFWVELQDLGDALSVLARFAQQLGVTIDEARDQIAQLGGRLGEERVLCVLDNAEHLPGLPELIGRLLAAAHGLVLIVTSRTRLHHASEWPLPLSGLPVPDEESRDLEAASAFDAVRLFEARAAAALRGFTLSRHLPAVIDIVESVDGLPLAIELAAGWVRLLPAEEIARDLRRSMDLLERDPATPGAPARPEHDSLRTVLDGSWKLLAPRERDALATLSVFQGGFTRAAALAVAQAPLPVLSSLVDKSLLAVDAAGRFGLHPLVAAYAAKRLAADPAHADACARRHAAHYAQFVVELADGAGADHQPLATGLEAEYANCRAAWQRAVADVSIDQLGQSVGAWRVYFDVRGRLAEGVAQLQPALVVAAAAPALAAALRAALSRLHYRRGDYAVGLSLALAGAEAAVQCGDRRTRAACVSNAGSCHSAEGRWAEARGCFEQALEIARADGVAIEEAAALNNLGIVAKKEGRYDDAIGHYAHAIAIERDLGHHAAVVRCLNNIGGLHGERDEWALARQAMAEGLQLCERYGLDGSIPNLAFGLGAALLELGDLDGAERYLQRALDSSRRTGIPVVALFAEANLGRVAARDRRFAAAIERLRGAAGSARERGWINESLQCALFYGECLREAGRPLDAACIWRMIDAHPQAEAGLRASARRWSEALSLGPAQRSHAEREPVTLAAVTDRLLSDQALDDMSLSDKR